MKQRRIVYLVSALLLITYISFIVFFAMVDKKYMSKTQFGVFIFIMILIPLIYSAVFLPIIIADIRNNKPHLIEDISSLESHDLSFVVYCANKNKIIYTSENIKAKYGIDVQAVLSNEYSPEKYGINFQREITHFIVNKEYEKGPILLEFINPDTDKKMSIENHLLIVTKGSNMFYISILHDVTKSFEQELLLTNKLSEASESAIWMQEVLSKVSHEIRTPLNGIIGMNKIAADSLENKDYDGVKNALDSVEKSGEYLFSIINNVLNVSKLDHSQMEINLEEFKLKDLIVEVTSMVKSQSSVKHLNISYELDNEEISIVSDRLKLMQIILNLVSNGIKYNKENGSIKIRVNSKPLPHNKVGVAFYIEDSGIGMSEGFVKKLFTPYVQENRQHDYPSTGLGLSIAKSLVTRLNGTISVNSIMNVGTTFKIKFVFDTTTRKNEHLSENLDIDLAGKKCLLVEDNEINAIICKSYLGKLKINTTRVSNGREACDLFFKEREHTFDFILMDIQMPVMDGYEASRCIRKSSKADNNIPIISLTADAFKDDVEKAFLNGMNGHISKPMKLDDLEKTICKVLSDFNKKNY